MTSNRVPTLPLLSLLLGAGMWGVSWYPMRLLENAGLSGIWLALILYAAALAFSLPWSAGAVNELRREWRTLAPLMVAGGWTNTAFVLAILDGNIMRVLLLFYLSPIWAAVLGWLLIGERVSRRSLATLLLAMAGALLLLWDPVSGVPWPRGLSDWLALSSGFAFALSNVFVRKGRTASIAGKSLSVWLGVVIVAGALIVAFAVPPPSISLATATSAAALGALGILTMTVLVQYGVTHMPVHRSAVILLFELVTGAISQQLLTEEIMTASGWTGGILIVAAAYLSARAAAEQR